MIEACLLVVGYFCVGIFLGTIYTYVRRQDSAFDIGIFAWIWPLLVPFLVFVILPSEWIAKQLKRSRLKRTEAAE